jgi:hypothetical protein
MRRFGASLAVFALYLQLAFATCNTFAASGGPQDAFAEHALCLSAATVSAQPASSHDQAPTAPEHHHTAFCCLWHQLPCLQPVAVRALGHVVLATITHDGPGDTSFRPGPQRGPGNARDPPILA